jgi:hypothetical protein
MWRNLNLVLYSEVPKPPLLLVLVFFNCLHAVLVLHQWPRCVLIRLSEKPCVEG